MNSRNSARLHSLLILVMYVLFAGCSAGIHTFNAVMSRDIKEESQIDQPRNDLQNVSRHLESLNFSEDDVTEDDASLQMSYSGTFDEVSGVRVTMEFLKEIRPDEPELVIRIATGPKTRNVSDKLEELWKQIKVRAGHSNCTVKEKKKSKRVLRLPK